MATSAVWPNNGQENSVSTPVEDDGPFVRMISVGGDYAPEAPSHSSDSSIAQQNFAGLAVKFAYTVQHFTTDWMGEQLCLPVTIVAELLVVLPLMEAAEPLTDHSYVMSGRLVSTTPFALNTVG